METNDTNNGPIDTGHCLNDLPVSGAFLMLAKNGDLMTVCGMIQQRAKLAAEIQKVEQQLRSCNHPCAVPDFVEWCEERKKDFVIEFIKRVEELELRRSQLTADLQRIDEQLALQNLGFEWAIKPGFASLVPERSFDAVVELRSLIICQHRGKGKSHNDICKILDSKFRLGKRPEGFLPEEWVDKYRVTTFLEACRHQHCRNLVDKMFSSAKRRWP